MFPFVPTVCLFSLEITTPVAAFAKRAVCLHLIFPCITVLWIHAHRASLDFRLVRWIACGSSWGLCVCSLLPALSGAGTSCKRGGRRPASGDAVNCLGEICLNLSEFLLIAYKLIYFVHGKSLTAVCCINYPEKWANDEMKTDTIISISQDQRRLWRISRKPPRAG